ncbi:MAG TPA: MFS transporter [Fimbriimonadaceae bacterium]|nr:MFS transporter [Fimbriimonadaceae bacterium]
MDQPERTVYRSGLGWQLGMSSFWFATSFKWFILLTLMVGQVRAIVPDGEKNQWWGLIFAIGAVEAMIGPGLYGYLSDRCRSRFGRRRPFIAIGGALTAVALVWLGFSNQLWMLLVGYIIVQVADDIGTGPYSALIPEYVPEAERGRAAGIMGLLKLTAQISAAVAGVLLGSVVLIYLTMAVINILAAIWVLYTVREPQYEPVSEPSKFEFSVALKGLLTPFKEPDFRWVWFTSFLNAFGFYLIVAYLPNYLKDAVFDMTAVKPEEVDTFLRVRTIGLAVVISLTGALASVFAGKLADRFGRKKIVIWSGWLMFATLIPFAIIPNYTVMLGLAVVFGVGYGAYLSSDWALVSDILKSRDDIGRDMGLWQMSVATPQVVAGGVGVLIDAMNQQYAPNHYGYTTAFLIASFGFLFGSTLVKRVRGSS